MTLSAGQLANGPSTGGIGCLDLNCNNLSGTGRSDELDGEFGCVILHSLDPSAILNENLAAVPVACVPYCHTAIEYLARALNRVGPPCCS